MAVRLTNRDKKSVARELGPAYYAAVGKVAIGAAQLEHSLHSAIVQAAGGHSTVVGRLVQDRSASELVDFFRMLHPAMPEIDPACATMRDLFQRRNAVLHSRILLSFPGKGRSAYELYNRKKPEKLAQLPTIRDLNKLSDDLANFSLMVALAEETRGFDYDWKKMIARFHEEAANQP